MSVRTRTVGAVLAATLSVVVVTQPARAELPQQGAPAGRCESTDVTTDDACIAIGKLVDPVDGTSFDFTSPQLGNFALVGEPLVNAISANPIKFTALRPGTFVIEELREPGFFPTGTLACDGRFDPGDVTFDDNAGNARITITLAGDEFANCDFFNNRHVVNVTKVATPADGTDFDYTSAEVGDFTLRDGDTQQFFVAMDTPVTITEVVPAGWQLDAIDCTISDPPDPADDPDGGFAVSTFATDVAAGTVEIEFGDLDSRTLDCTFTNSELPPPTTLPPSTTTTTTTTTITTTTTTLPPPPTSPPPDVLPATGSAGSGPLLAWGAAFVGLGLLVLGSTRRPHRV